ncbi:MAG: hypothetical protein HY925_09455 [Elusimicrobia bacterium]|nr:hypothetical protein [Elusimicrobiota bacterium]
MLLALWVGFANAQTRPIELPAAPLGLPASAVGQKWERRAWVELKAASVITAVSLGATLGWEGAAAAAAATVLASVKLSAPKIAPLAPAAPLAAAAPAPAAALTGSESENLLLEQLSELGLRPDAAELTEAIERAGGLPEPAFFRSADQRVVQEVGVINRTEFFRDPRTWKNLRPRLETIVALKAADGDRSLVLKSVGGSDGSEAYSVAMLLDDVLRSSGEDPGRWKIRVEVYDFNPTNRVLAALGYYRGPPQAWARYFEPGGGKWSRVRSDIRSWIVPRPLEIRKPSDWPRLADHPGEVLFFRYVQPYLDREVQLKPFMDFLRAGSWAKKGGAVLIHTPWRKGVLWDEAGETIEPVQVL